MQLRDHHVVPNVEFPLFVEERPINVQLHYESLLRPILMLRLRFDYAIQFIYLINDSDPIASIGQFSWLHNPYVAHPPMITL